MDSGFEKNDQSIFEINVRRTCWQHVVISYNYGIIKIILSFMNLVMIILHPMILSKQSIGKKIIVISLSHSHSFLALISLLANYLVFTYKQTGRVQLYDIQKNKSVELSTVGIDLRKGRFRLFYHRQKLNIVHFQHRANI